MWSEYFLTCTKQSPKSHTCKHPNCCTCWSPYHALHVCLTPPLPPPPPPPFPTEKPSATRLCMVLPTGSPRGLSSLDTSLHSDLEHIWSLAPLTVSLIPPSMKFLSSCLHWCLGPWQQARLVPLHPIMPRLDFLPIGSLRFLTAFLQLPFTAQRRVPPW